MDVVDVAAKDRYAAERHRPQRAESGHYRLMYQQFLPRLRGHLGRHPIVVRLATAECVDVAAQGILAAGRRRCAHRRRPHRWLARFERLDRKVAHAASGQDDLEALPRRIGDDPGTLDIGEVRGRAIVADRDRTPALAFKVEREYANV